MKRIIIVGNGFDLSCGLPTQYEKFLVHYFKSVIEIAYDKQNKTHRTGLIEVRIRPTAKFYFKNEFSSIHTIEDLFSVQIIGLGRINDNINRQNFHGDIIINIKSQLFDRLFINKGWNDIESVYFDYLLQIFELHPNEPEQIKQVHKDFLELKLNLEQYIQSEIEPLIGSNDLETETKSSFLKKCFKPASPAYQTRFLDGDKIITQIDYTKAQRYPDPVLFLNFNYTTALKKVLHEFLNKPYQQILPIHGEIGTDQKIIFGYGDDSHPKYSEIDQFGDKEYFRYNKAQYYPFENYYIYLMNFIESSSYDVFVAGHSLGLSDRVLLKTIFENENCKAIQLFHRGNEESYFNKYIALSRHFSDKLKMRRKIVEYDESDTL